MTVEGEDEDLINNNILETEGHREVEGPHIENLDITASLKTKQVNIGTEAKPKFARIGDYWMIPQWIKLLSYFPSNRIFFLPSFRT